MSENEYPYLKNEYVVLRGPLKKDAAVLAEAFEQPFSKEQAEKLIDRIRCSKRIYVLIIADLCDEAVGMMELYHLNEEVPEIGYRITPSKRGMGYAKQALGLFLEYLEEKNIKKVKAGALKENIASIRILESNHFRLVSETKEENYYEYESKSNITER